MIVPKHTTPAKHVINLVLFVLLAVSLPNLVEYTIYQVTPFEFNVNHINRVYDTVCQGDNIVQLHLIREVRPSTGVPASATTELVKFVDGKTIETDWKKSRNFIYQKDNSIISVEVALPKDLPVGTYGFNEHVTIYPFWGVEKSKTFPADQALFDVVNCN